MKKQKKMIKTGLLAAGILTAVYVVGAVWFSQHFFPKTFIDGRDVGGRTAEKVKKEWTDEVNTYVLDIKTRDKKTEHITGNEISLSMAWDGTVKKMIQKQNVFAWPVKLFSKKKYTGKVLVTYDPDRLDTAVSGLECMDKKKQKAPENAKVSSYDKESGYTLVPCVMGTTIDKERMIEAVDQSVNALQEELSLEQAGVYQDPVVLDDDKRLAKAIEKMNRYAEASITYQFGAATEVLDAETFGDWFKLTKKKLKPVLRKDKVEEYVSQLCRKYNTCYSAKTFKTSYGKTISVPVSHYGWKIDSEAENKQIRKEIKSGKTVTREPNYSMTANSHEGNDYGDSYVEINLTAQHLFLYKKGKLILETDFVSGNISKNNGTPTGIYGITYTEKDATLRGEDYESHVAYWMPFAGNVGMHDAPWRSKFGGKIYKYAGSHGCVNLPPDAAKKVFENVGKNYPVIVYELPGSDKPEKTEKEKKPKQEKKEKKKQKASDKTAQKKQNE